MRRGYSATPEEDARRFFFWRDASEDVRGKRWIYYVRDIVKLVIMLREPTSFLIAGNCGTGLRDLL